MGIGTVILVALAGGIVAKAAGKFFKAEREADKSIKETEEKSRLYLQCIDETKEKLIKRQEQVKDCLIRAIKEHDVQKMDFYNREMQKIKDTDLKKEALETYRIRMMKDAKAD